MPRRLCQEGERQGVLRGLRCSCAQCLDMSCRQSPMLSTITVPENLPCLAHACPKLRCRPEGLMLNSCTGENTIKLDCADGTFAGFRTVQLRVPSLFRAFVVLPVLSSFIASCPPAVFLHMDHHLCRLLLCFSFRIRPKQLRLYLLGKFPSPSPEPEKDCSVESLNPQSR